MARHKIILPCIESTYISASSPNSNYGTVDHVLIGAWRGYNAYFKFDFSSIPAGKKIIEYNICLYVMNSALSTYGTSISISKNTMAWSENSLTYNMTNHTQMSSTVLSVGNQAPGGYVKIKKSGLYGDIQYFQDIAVMATELSGYSYIQCSSHRHANKPYIELIYEDAYPDTPILKAPEGEYKDNLSSIRLEWQYMSSVGGTQKKYDIQWSSNLGSTWETESRVTDEEFHILSPDTLPSGAILWRARTYNEYDEASLYSDAMAFFSVGKPVTPQIQTIENKPRPKISWGAENQQLFQIQIEKAGILLFDTGELAGVGMRMHKLKVFLSDGNYKAKVRIKNQYDLYSDWSERSFDINTTKPNAPEIEIFSIRNGQRIESDTEGAIVYRKNELEDFFYPVGIITGGHYNDYATMNGIRYEYFVRKDNESSYCDSSIVTKVARVSCFVLSDSKYKEVIEFKYGIKAENKELSFNKNVSLLQYAGRSNPVAESNGSLNESITIELFCDSIKKERELQRILKLSNMVLLRDKEDLMYCNISGYKRKQHSIGYVVNFVATKVDYSEEIEV